MHNLKSAIWNRKILLIILIAGAAIRIFLVGTAAGVNNDAFKYVRTAQEISRSGVMAGLEGDHYWPYYPVNRQLVFYPLVGSGVNHLVGDMVLSLRIVSAMAGIGLIWLAYTVSKELFDKEPVALLAAGLLAFHPELAEASASVFREALTGFLLMLELLMLLWARRGKRSWPAWAALSGLILFAGFMTRPDAAAAAAGMGGVTLLVGAGLKWPKRLAIVTVMGAMFLALEVPYVLMLKQKTGYWMVTQWQIQSKMGRLEAARRHLLDEGEDHGSSQ
ncbi:MAG: glycosyltransferase family 39 protein [Planctomycetota bacterium]